MANIIWTPPDGWVEESGAHVSFKAPCDCSVAGNLVIGSNSYSIVDAIGRTITGIGGAFASGAVLDFILDCEKLKAYLQNSAPADYIVEQGSSGRWNYRKWNSGRSEAWLSIGYSFSSSSSSSAPYMYTPSISIPSGIFNDKPFATGSVDVPGFVSYIRWTGTSATNLNTNIYTFTKYGSGNSCSLFIYAWGTWK